MTENTANEFRALIKKERKNNFPTPFDVSYKAFTDLGYDKKDKEWFINNASLFVESMRSQSWTEFVQYEREFNKTMLLKLVEPEKLKGMDPVKAVETFVTNHPEQIYDLSLSNTQSRRSRAGKEFEAIIELMLVGADIPAEAQGAIGKKEFMDKKIGKLVDFVSPGVVQYLHNKVNTVLISAKTTLRERWQEVPEEVTRTGAREMFLATLDHGISKETQDILYESNIYIATTTKNKEQAYNNNSRIFSFEDMLSRAQDMANKWNNETYNQDELDQMCNHLERQIKSHKNHKYVKEYYQNKLAELKKSISEN